MLKIELMQGALCARQTEDNAHHPQRVEDLYIRWGGAVTSNKYCLQHYCLLQWQIREHLDTFYTLPAQAEYKLKGQTEGEKSLMV